MARDSAEHDQGCGETHLANMLSSGAIHCRSISKKSPHDATKRLFLLIQKAVLQGAQNMRA